MLKIGKSYIKRKNGFSRLCADVVIDNHRTTIWFAVDSLQEKYLCLGRADPFIMVLFPTALRGSHEIVCEDVMSERLHYQLCSCLMPALCFAGKLYHKVRIRAAFTAEPYQNCGDVGTAFTGGVDSLYSIMTHRENSEYPLTYVTLFNAGAFEGDQYRHNFWESSLQVEAFARELNLQSIFVDTNFNAVLPERFLDVFTFRNLACALALQGLFSIYLLSSGYDAASFGFNLRHAASYDLLTVNCATTETLSCYSAGAAVKRLDKLQALMEWTPSWNWLHPCFVNRLGEHNCGHCKKCIRDFITLYALGGLNYYGSVFDIRKGMRNLSKYVGVMLADHEDPLCKDVLWLLKEKGIKIPDESFVYAEQFQRSMRNLKSACDEV